MNLRNSIQQKGGVGNYFQSLFRKSSPVVQESGKQSKSNKSNKRNKQDNNSDNDTVKISKPKAPTPAPIVQSNQDQGSTDQSEGENINTTEEGDLLVLHPIKRKVKKTY